MSTHASFYLSREQVGLFCTYHSMHKHFLLKKSSPDAQSLVFCRRLNQELFVKQQFLRIFCYSRPRT
uniref:Uncharacterized protein n=1 Tax=Manihot esculenta TaxID=3983 RepID=A0A2C9VZ92_MANES